VKIPEPAEEMATAPPACLPYHENKNDKECKRSSFNSKCIISEKPREKERRRTRRNTIEITKEWLDLDG
tara:strand:- start:200 stop:406 length:207 start_codon:yes stop_codon:yes gene_type:complete